MLPGSLAWSWVQTPLFLLPGAALLCKEEELATLPSLINSIYGCRCVPCTLSPQLGEGPLGTPY